MIGPVDEFTSLGVTQRWTVDIVPDAPTASAISREIASALEQNGLEQREDTAYGQYVKAPGKEGEQLLLERKPLYTATRGDEVLAGIRAHIALIAERHGPGRVWFLDDPVHVVKDDMRPVIQLVAGSLYPHVLLRTFYAHENQGARL